MGQATVTPAIASPELRGFLDEVQRLVDAELDRRLAPPGGTAGQLDGSAEVGAAVDATATRQVRWV